MLNRCKPTATPYQRPVLPPGFPVHSVAVVQPPARATESEGHAAALEAEEGPAERCNIQFVSATSMARTLRKPHLLDDAVLLYPQAVPKSVASVDGLEVPTEPTITRATTGPSSPKPTTSDSQSVPIVLSTATQAVLDAILKEFAQVFNDRPSLPALRPGANHRVRFTPGEHDPPARPPFRLAPEEDAELRKQLTRLLQDEFIYASCSPYGAPVLFVRKKDGQLRMCVDYRLLNKITQRDAYPLPRIQDLLDDLHGASAFSKIDLKAGYYQLRMDPQDECKTAFATRYGTFQWRVLPLGLCNAPSTFQRAMQRIFAPLIGVCLFIYLDDLIIYSATMEDHLGHLRAVMELLTRHQLYLNAGKCEFAHVSLAFLGHIVGPGAIAMESGKVAAITDWPEPTSKKELQAFLGLANYYRRFIAHFAQLSAPLTDLLQDYCPGTTDDDRGEAGGGSSLPLPGLGAQGVCGAQGCYQLSARASHARPTVAVRHHLRCIGRGGGCCSRAGRWTRTTACSLHFEETFGGGAKLRCKRQGAPRCHVCPPTVSCLRARAKIYAANGPPIVAIPTHATHADGAFGALGGDCRRV